MERRTGLEPAILSLQAQAGVARVPTLWPKPPTNTFGGGATTELRSTGVVGVQELGDERGFVRTKLSLMQCRSRRVGVW